MRTKRPTRFTAAFCFLVSIARASATSVDASDVDFVRHVQPILEVHCVSCHRAEKAEGRWDISSKEAAMSTGDNAPNIVPYQYGKSAIYNLLILASNDEERMPPPNTGDPLPQSDIEIIRLWLEQGAVWPDEVKLVAKAKPSSETGNPDTRELVARIHARIVHQANASDNVKFESYDSVIPKSGISFTMIAIAGGEFMMGSPDTERERNEDEGPRVKKRIGPFWMGKHEVTWDEFEPFQLTEDGRNKDGSLKVRATSGDPVDAISQPTPPYQPMDFGMGRKRFPAVCMTQHAANKYCQWLSAQTGCFYRLPTEAEWEYAARAGTDTAYWWGDDPSSLPEHGWFYDNSSKFQYSQIGKKKPNPWGLHDMYGNVCEWCLDQYSDDTYRTWGNERDESLDGRDWVKSKTPYPHVVRGGSYDDDAKDCRSASRKGSDPSWKQQDPQLPKSIWYLTDAPWLGFRIVRPLEIPSVDEMYAAWNNGVASE